MKNLPNLPNTYTESSKNTKGTKNRISEDANYECSQKYANIQKKREKNNGIAVNDEEDDIGKLMRTS